MHSEATPLPARLGVREVNGEINFLGRQIDATLSIIEQDRGKRFALWALLHMLGGAPDLDASFEHEDDRNAARNFMELLEASGHE